MSIVKELPVTAWAYISKADDVDGCWVAQIFEYGIISIGDSPEHALAMVREALQIALDDDLANNLNPERRRAPEEKWAPLLDMFANHKKKVPVSGMDKTSAFERFAAPVTVVLTVVEESQPDLGGESLAA